MNNTPELLPFAYAIVHNETSERQLLWEKPPHGSGIYREDIEVVPLYRRPEPPQWKNAIIDALVVAHIYTKDHDTDPRKALHDLIAWEVAVALDPKVSAEARALIERGRKAEPPPRITAEMNEWNRLVDRLREGWGCGHFGLPEKDGAQESLIVHKPGYSDAISTILTMAYRRQLAPIAAQSPEQGRGESLCGDCPPPGYPTDKTRCLPCPRRYIVVEPQAEGQTIRAEDKLSPDVQDFLDKRAAYLEACKKVQEGNDGAFFAEPFNSQVSSAQAQPALIYHPEGSPGSLTWKAVLEYTQSLNKQAYGDHTSWRLPTLPELEAPRCLDVCNPAVDKSRWPQIKPEFYWSSSVFVGDRDCQWGVNFSSGGTGILPCDNTGFVLAVCDR